MAQTSQSLPTVISIPKDLTIVSDADKRFMGLFKRYHNKVTEAIVIEYYRTHVRRKDFRLSVEYDEKTDKYVTRNRGWTRGENRARALAWFDRNLGRILRKKILAEDNVKY